MIEAGQHYKKKNMWKEVWRRLKKSKLALLGIAALGIFVFLIVFADIIADYDKMVITQNTAIRLQPPSGAHWFGTDEYGRDVFARIIHGGRVSLTVGLMTTLISALLGGIIGAVAGYYRGMIDNVIMRINDMIMGIPGILLAIAIAAALGPGIRNLIIALTISQVPGFTRIIRSMILTVIEQDFVEAAKAYGSSDPFIIGRHIIPNAMGPIIVQATMTVANMILATAALSYLGMGVQPPAPEWGAMLSDGKEYMRYSPYIVVYPGLAIALLALSLNLVGDGMRDALDPRLKN